jgi:hypothetical protein
MRSSWQSVIASRRSHPHELARKSAFPEELSLVQYAEGCFLANLRYYGELYLAYLNVEYCVCLVPLREDYVILLKRHDLSSLGNGGKELARI